jgi:hypothetical protein
METTTSDSVGLTRGNNLPEWLTYPDPAPPNLSPEAKKLHVARFEAVYPRIINMIAAGYNMTKAVEELPIAVDVGAFRRWIKKDPVRNEELRESEELRSEVWADLLVKHAMGEMGMEDVSRSTLVVNTLKWRISADNRRKYGETKTVEFGGAISIVNALAQAKSRVIEAEVIDVAETPLKLEHND